MRPVFSFSCSDGTFNAIKGKIINFAPMKLVRKIAFALSLALAAMLAGSCGVGKIKDLSLSSMGVKYIVPTSTRSMDAVLLLGIDNPSVTFTLSDVSGTILYYDRPLANFTTGELPVQGRSVQVYELPCTISLCNGVSLLDLLVIASKRSLDGMCADVDLHAKINKGPGATLHFSKIDLSQFSE